MESKAGFMVDHYQKTYELTYEVWRQRNRIFLILLGVIGAATLLTLRVPQANSLLVDLVAKALSLTDPDRIETLRKSFPFSILQSVLLLVVFYLMVNLYHRSLWVLRHYRYLGLLETEIRQELSLQEPMVTFSREGGFYWTERGEGLSRIKWVYVVLLGLLLLSFLVAKAIDDVRTGSGYLIAVDILTGVPTLYFYWVYVRSSVRSDRPEKEAKAHPAGHPK
jgi:hypothetical protein